MDEDEILKGETGEDIWQRFLPMFRQERFWHGQSHTQSKGAGVYKYKYVIVSLYSVLFFEFRI